MISFRFILIICVGSAIQCEKLLSFRDKRYFKTNQCGLQFQSIGFVVGGVGFKRGDFPWMAALMYKSDDKPPAYYCAGTLMSVQHVLTGELILNKILHFKKLS